MGGGSVVVVYIKYVYLCSPKTIVAEQMTL